MKNKYLQIICHILIVPLIIYAWSFDRPPFAESNDLMIIRTVLGALAFAYFPYLFLGWAKSTRSFAVYVCLAWVLLKLYSEVAL